MARPRISDHPLTNAEKQARYRARKKAEGLTRRDDWAVPEGRRARPGAEGPGPGDPPYEELRRALDSARRELESTYERWGIWAENARIETALKDAAVLIGTEAERRIPPMLQQWKIREFQAEGIIEKRVIRRLKKLKAFS